jgi:hypothetical protein
MMSDEVSRYGIDIPEIDLVGFRRRLERTR